MVLNAKTKTSNLNKLGVDREKPDQLPGLARDFSRRQRTKSVIPTELRSVEALAPLVAAIAALRLA
jgi:hypothetical protein